MEKVLEKGRQAGAEYCEVRIGSKAGTSLEIKDGELKKAVHGIDKGASIRLLYKGTWGFASTNDLSERSLKEALEYALRLAKGSCKRIKEKAVLTEVEPVRDKAIWKLKKDPRGIDIEEKRNLLLDMERAAKERKGLHSVTTGYADNLEKMHFLNSEGADCYSEVMRVYVRERIIARGNGNVIGFTLTCGGTGGFEIFDMEDPIERSVKGAESAVRILKANRSPSGRFPIVVDNDLTGVFAHEALGHAAEGDTIVSGASCLEGRIGERIGSDLITIVDDPTKKHGFGSFPFDAEGMLAKRKVLVEEGVLKDFILNRESAYKLGMRPNGGARAESYAVRPLVRMSNTFIENGDNTLEELFEGIKKGVYAKGTRGGQVDPAKGSFQFMAQEAFLIEKGEVTIPLKDVAFAGSTLGILKNIDAVGNDFKFGHPGSCGKGPPQWVPVSDGGPHIRVKEAVLGGGG